MSKIDYSEGIGNWYISNECSLELDVAVEKRYIYDKISIEKAREILQSYPNLTGLVRESTTTPGALTLSFKYNGKIHHMRLINGIIRKEYRVFKLLVNPQSDNL